MIVKCCSAISSAIGAIAGMVAIWALAGFVGVAAYRRQQIPAHQCLAQIPAPLTLFHTGVVALVIAVIAGVLAIILTSDGFRMTTVWILVVYAVIMAPILITASIYYGNMQQIGSMSPAACVSGDDGL
ncbi:hypothetical protein [Mycolicibacterium goodii]|uniref:hypothetical protein n=1 Tax=Mycolicibacterium goodii TaxID=134601 RepID=UPI0012FF998D